MDANYDDYIKHHFEFQMFCNSRFNSATTNILTRIQNTVASAINNHISLPKYMLLILDDDLITYLDYKGSGVSELLGKWLSWLIQQIEKLVSARLNQLPPKAKQEYEPCIYWCLAPLHMNFSAQHNDIRRKLNLCLESLLKSNHRMRVIKMKEKWEFSNQSLVQNDKITETGLYTYWDSIDSAFRFNVSKHDIFLPKLKCSTKPEVVSKKNQMNVLVNNDIRRPAAFKSDGGSKETSTEERVSNRRLDDIQMFFQCHKNDPFHWSRRGQSNYHRGNHFGLPKLRRC